MVPDAYSHASRSPNITDRHHSITHRRTDLNRHARKQRILNLSVWVEECAPIQTNESIGAPLASELIQYMDYVTSHIGQNITKICTQITGVLAEKRQTSAASDLGVIDTKSNLSQL